MLKTILQVIVCVLISASVATTTVLVALHPSAIGDWVAYSAAMGVMAFFLSAGVRYWMDAYSEWRW